MKFVTICSGIEAPSVAWRPLGWEALAFAEVDKFCSAVLEARQPGVPNLGDVTAEGFLERMTDHGRTADIVCAGTPCQGFSVAGQRGGMDDPRSRLAFVFRDLVQRVRPRWLVWENVPGVLSSNGGRDFGAFLRSLVDCGYGVVYRVLDARFFGLAQRRKRVFVVGHFGAWQPAAAVLFERDGVCWNPQARRETREDVDPMVARCLNGKGGIGRIDGESETFVTHTLHGEGFDASEDGTGRGIPLVAGTLGHGRKSAGSATNQDAESGLLIPVRAIRTNAGGQVMDQGDCAAALTTMTDSTAQFLMGYEGVRRLTPTECERLMGFPDDYSLVEHRGKPAADGPRYKALGNSIAVPILRWIGERIAAADQSIGGLAASR